MMAGVRRAAEMIVASRWFAELDLD